MDKIADWYVIREAEKNGFIASMTSTAERNRTEMNEKLSDYFREHLPTYDNIYDEEVCEDVLYSLGEYIDEFNIDMPHIDFPMTEGTDTHLLKITDNLYLKILVADEYFGGGDYSKYIEISNFVINKDTTEKDVDALIKFAEKYLQAFSE